MRDQLKMSWVTLDRFCEEEAAKDESLRCKLEADHRPLLSSASTLTDDELLGKLGSMGFELDRRGVEDLCAEAHRDGDMPRACVGPDWHGMCIVAAFIAGAARGTS